MQEEPSSGTSDHNGLASRAFHGRSTLVAPPGCGANADRARPKDSWRSSTSPPDATKESHAERSTKQGKMVACAKGRCCRRDGARSSGGTRFVRRCGVASWPQETNCASSSLRVPPSVRPSPFPRRTSACGWGRPADATHARKRFAGCEGTTAHVAVVQPAIDQFGHFNAFHRYLPMDLVGPRRRKHPHAAVLLPDPPPSAA